MKNAVRPPSVYGGMCNRELTGALAVIEASDRRCYRNGKPLMESTCNALGANEADSSLIGYMAAVRGVVAFLEDVALIRPLGAFCNR
jgi:hypothetical protein